MTLAGFIMTLAQTYLRHEFALSRQQTLVNRIEERDDGLQSRRPSSSIDDHGRASDTRAGRNPSARPRLRRGATTSGHSQLEPCARSCRLWPLWRGGCPHDQSAFRHRAIKTPAGARSHNWRHASHATKTKSPTKPALIPELHNFWISGTPSFVGCLLGRISGPPYPKLASYYQQLSGRGRPTFKCRANANGRRDRLTAPVR